MKNELKLFGKKLAILVGLIVVLIFPSCKTNRLKSEIKQQDVSIDAAQKKVKNSSDITMAGSQTITNGLKLDSTRDWVEFEAQSASYNDRSGLWNYQIKGKVKHQKTGYTKSAIRYFKTDSLKTAKNHYARHDSSFKTDMHASTGKTKSQTVGGAKFFIGLILVAGTLFLLRKGQFK